MKVTARSSDIVNSFADEEEISIIVIPPVIPDLVSSVQLHSISPVQSTLQSKIVEEKVQ